MESCLLKLQLSSTLLSTLKVLDPENCEFSRITVLPLRTLPFKPDYIADRVRSLARSLIWNPCVLLLKTYFPVYLFINYEKFKILL